MGDITGAPTDVIINEKALTLYPLGPSATARLLNLAKQGIMNRGAIAATACEGSEADKRIIISEALRFSVKIDLQSEEFERAMQSLDAMILMAFLSIKPGNKDLRLDDMDKIAPTNDDIAKIVQVVVRITGWVVDEDQPPKNPPKAEPTPASPKA